jgi:hypothetical protein
MSKKTHEVNKMAAQGDVLFIYLGKVPLPTGLKEVAREEDGKLVVTHSETGHHHATDNPEVRMFEEESTVCYLQMGDVCDFTIDHHRPFDTHDSLKLLGEPGGIWKVHKQREHTPEGWRKVQD